MRGNGRATALGLAAVVETIHMSANVIERELRCTITSFIHRHLYQLVLLFCFLYLGHQLALHLTLKCLESILLDNSELTPTLETTSIATLI